MDCSYFSNLPVPSSYLDIGIDNFSFRTDLTGTSFLERQSYTYSFRTETYKNCKLANLYLLKQASIFLNFYPLFSALVVISWSLEFNHACKSVVKFIFNFKYACLLLLDDDRFNWTQSFERDWVVKFEVRKYPF